MKLYFSRHGESEANVQQIFWNQPEGYGLTDKGREQALALADELGMHPEAAHCHLGLGQLYGQTGRSEAACAALSTTIELYRAMDMTFWLPQAEAALAQVEGR